MLLRLINFLLTTAFVLAAQDKPASIEGAVSDSVTGERIVRAHVMLRGIINRNPKEYGAMTGPDGKYSMTAVEPGTYMLTTERTGFVPGGGQPVRIELTAGAARTEANLKLTPCGSLSG